ncbi:sensor histidine kinase [Nonomuraea endophytica]|uniref:histidine kinase n=1 Tax=Nonomuraea endophytica TaxID=714136 RepID=A0A7W8A9C8_9ACTN|nr:HAMP domain-containing sensor histidine kinase [Nonomuraea endophytica]MBB5081050.1 signal transduction histidine kinase [Nonomuraea endophytica]
MLSVVTLALGLSIFAAWNVLLTRVDERIAAEFKHEYEELRGYAAKPPTSDLEDLLVGYLQVNVADRWEMFFTVVDGQPLHKGRAESPAPLDEDAALVARVAEAQRPETGEWPSKAGEVRYVSIPIQIKGDPRQGHFVIAIFYEHHRQEVVDAVRVLAFTSLAALAMAGAAGWFVAGRVLAPVRMVRQAAEHISDSSDLTRRLDVVGNDDVAALARTFNHMLDRLQRAFEVQREFVDDAGHELRTPITVIRGHLELMGDDPAEREETLALVTDELNRMNRIVDDLLTLAKSEQPGFLSLEEVELADLTVSVIAKARALGERDWRVDEVAEARIVADRQRLTQALMQLAANAVRHTQEGALVAAGSAVDGDRVRLWVRDGGPGVRPEDRERIFQRFVRAGSRSHQGAGLGLSIVRSIAEAHGGRVWVEDGARFVIELQVDGKQG